MAVVAVLLVALVAAALVLLAALRLRPAGPFPKPLPPCYPSRIPWLGAGLAFGRAPLQFAERCYRQYGDVFTIPVSGQRLTFLVGPDAHKPFFRAPDEEIDQNEPYKFSVPIFGPGVVFDAPLWKRTQQLRIMSHSLRAEKLKSYVPLIVEEANAFFGRWGNEGVVDIRQEFSELTILTAARTLMGKEIRETMSDEVAHLYQELDEGLTTLSFFWPSAPIPAHKRRDAARLRMVELFSKVIHERRQRPNEEHNDVLQVFMDARYKDGSGCSEEEVTGLMIALLFAGQHTSSITASWTGLLMLAHKEGWVPRLLEEQRKVVAEHGDELDFKALGDMVLLKRCIMEALRMYPPLIFVMRKVMKGFEYNNYYVPEVRLLPVFSRTVFACALRCPLDDTRMLPDCYGIMDCSL